MSAAYPNPGVPQHPGYADPLQQHEKARLRAAARHARQVYPGDVGELLFRELNAYAEFGLRISTDALIPRLATTILAMPLPADEPQVSPRVARLIAMGLGEQVAHPEVNWQ